MQQVKATAGALREQLEQSRAERDTAVQAERQAASGEIALLRETIQAMRAQLDTPAAKGK